MTSPNQNLHLDILPPSQRSLWPLLNAVSPIFRKHGFVMYGGTALALQLGHRDSVDFDFFSSARFSPGVLHGSHKLFSDSAISLEKDNVLILKITPVSGLPPVEVSFHGNWKINMAKPPILADNGVSLASIEDIFGTKCLISYRRPKIRDYRDVSAILERTDLTLQDGLEFARVIYGKAFNPMLALGALAYFDDLKPERGEAPLPMSDRTQISAAVKRCDPGLIRSLDPFLRRITPAPPANNLPGPDFER